MRGEGWPGSEGERWPWACASHTRGCWTLQALRCVHSECPFTVLVSTLTRDARGPSCTQADTDHTIPNPSVDGCFHCELVVAMAGVAELPC